VAKSCIEGRNKKTGVWIPAPWDGAEALQRPAKPEPFLCPIYGALIHLGAPMHRPSITDDASIHSKPHRLEH